MNLIEKLGEMGFESVELNKSIYATRKETGKKIFVINKRKLTKKDEFKSVRNWVKYEMHPFWFDGKFFYDLLFGDKLSSI